MSTLAEHPTFDSLEEMLAPASLSALLGTQGAPADLTTLESNGFSTNQLSYVRVGDRRLVLKRLRADDWLARAVGDDGCRSVAVWRTGLLDRLEPGLRHGIVAGCRDGDGHALLMQDCSAGFVPESSPVSDRRMRGILEALAHMHARCWGSEDLDDPAYELADVEELLTMLWPRSWHLLESASGPRWANADALTILQKGWEALLELTTADVRVTLEEVVADPGHLVDTLSAEPTTLLHGDYRHDNVAVMPDGSVVAIDWQFAGRGPGVMDLAWFVMSGRSLEFRGWAFDHYRDTLAEALGGSLDVPRWERALAIAKLAEVLRKGVIHAYFAAEGSAEARWFIEESNEWVRQGAEVL